MDSLAYASEIECPLEDLLLEYGLTIKVWRSVPKAYTAGLGLHENMATTSRLAFVNYFSRFRCGGPTEEEAQEALEQYLRTHLEEFTTAYHLFCLGGNTIEPWKRAYS